MLQLCTQTQIVCVADTLLHITYIFGSYPDDQTACHGLPRSWQLTAWASIEGCPVHALWTEPPVVLGALLPVVQNTRVYKTKQTMPDDVFVKMSKVGILEGSACESPFNW
jgi:hypothetical protein